MTSNEVLILATGLYLGFVITAAVHMVWAGIGAARAARSTQAAATAALKRAAGDQWLTAFQLDRLIHRRKEQA
ncbi:hypothetical protein [Streptomyces brevispora]|uniref:Uncharacterized protein n=1 Tax=Streptomyces brevispora TaxID=887462 RepID=A0ABZ1G8C2_9ACTN|nr:hypothetical protein [Streptomyces brevispora]WSC14928.1 hypothetical protein OIE64_20190 [Streptomyces brevispora]